MQSLNCHIHYLVYNEQVMLTSPQGTSVIDRKQFITNLGFVDDPFAHVDADEEVRLPEYFVRPPYFLEAFGDPGNPKSFFVFAPRGGGKTAQRIMMEQQCEKNDVLAITYVDFDYFGCKSVNEIDLEHHIRRILASGWLGILASLFEEPSRVSSLSDESKHFTKTRLDTFVGPLDKAAYRSVLDSLKGRFQSFKDNHSVLTGTVSWLLDTIMKVVFKTDIPEIHIDNSSLEVDEQFDARMELDTLVHVAQEIGYKSVYVLVDRIDESELTGNNASDSFALIRPLVRSLKTLETPGIAFKFFLWDAIEPHFKGVGRSDRITRRRLEWTPEKLSELLRKRLIAHSDSKVWKLDQIGGSSESFNIDEVAIMFANESPRDLIRVCGKFVAEQEQLNSASASLTSQAVAIAVDGICLELLDDRIDDKHLDQLRQVGNRRNQVDFTVSHAATSLKISTESSRSRIQKWKDAGAIVELSLVANPDQTKWRRVKLYGVADIRLARLMCGQLDAFQFMEKKVRKCHNAKCARYMLRDWDEADSTTVCHRCFYDSDMYYHGPDRIPVVASEDECLESQQLNLFLHGK